MPTDLLSWLGKLLEDGTWPSEIALTAIDDQADAAIEQSGGHPRDVLFSAVVKLVRHARAAKLAGEDPGPYFDSACSLIRQFSEIASIDFDERPTA